MDGGSDLLSPIFSGFRLVWAVGLSVDKGQVFEDEGDVGMLRAQGGLGNCKGSIEKRLGFGISALG